MSNKRSTKQEIRIASMFQGGRRQVASGATPFQKQDVKSDLFLLEVKYTDSTGYRLTDKYMKNVIKNAHKVNKIPALIVEFSDASIYAVIRMEEFIDYERLVIEELNGRPEETIQEGEEIQG